VRHLQIYNSSSNVQRLWIFTDIHNKSILQGIRVNGIIYKDKNNHYLLSITILQLSIIFKAVTFDCLLLLILFLHQVLSSKDCSGSPALALPSFFGSLRSSSSLNLTNPSSRWQFYFPIIRCTWRSQFPVYFLMSFELSTCSLFLILSFLT
jgi:hypothetical protein